MGGHKERTATLNRDAGVRSRYRRCPQCRKRRLYWMKANYWNETRKSWKKLADGTEVCYICGVGVGDTDTGEPDWNNSARIYGGDLDKMPKPHVHFYGGERKRPVKARVFTWIGMSMGARHWYAELKEEPNPIWDSSEHAWRVPFHDQESQGRTIQDNANTEAQAIRQVKVMFRREFSENTHILEWRRSAYMDDPIPEPVIVEERDQQGFLKA